MIDPNAFREFEHRGWQGIPQQYHEAFGQLTTQSIEPLLDAAGVKNGARVIDIASGPGYVAAAAARRGATVIGVDFSAAMVAEAQGRNPDVEFREGNIIKKIDATKISAYYFSIEFSLKYLGSR